MYDGITPENIPRNAEMVASYIDGAWPNYRKLATLFPNAIRISIAVDPAHDADVLDIERGDALPTQAVAWANRQWARGKHPTCYMSANDWPAVMSQFLQHGAPMPNWWVAHQGAPDILPANAVALQNIFAGIWDRSIVADYWPGIDPLPAPPAPPPLPPDHRDEDDMYGIPHIVFDVANPARALLVYPSGEKFPIQDNSTTVAYEKAGSPVVPVGTLDFDRMLAEAPGLHPSAT